MNTLPKRKSTRLKGYDYSSAGAYFITICTKGRKSYLSKINVGQGLAPAENILTQFGNISMEQIETICNYYTNMKIDKYVIMPNHIHLIIMIDENTAGASPCPTISDIVCALKSKITLLCKESGFNEKQMFQNSFHDHIIRGENDYRAIWEYIDTNAAKWDKDCFYTD